MGYGYGIWLRIKDPLINNLTKHTPHATLMCNMDKTEATALYNDLKLRYKGDYKIYTNGICQHFNDSYGDEDILKACGYYCEIKDFKTLNKICLNYKGTIPDYPHISTDYNISKNKLTLLDIRPVTDDSILSLVDINSDDPMEWKILDC